jgi:hypothetical protein
MGKRLSEAAIGRYQRDGFLFPVDAFSPDEARHYLDRLESFEREDGLQFGKGHNFKPQLQCETRPGAMLVRGVDRYGHFDDEPRPQTDHGPAERALHAEVVARFREANREETLRYEDATS